MLEYQDAARAISSKLKEGLPACNLRGSGFEIQTLVLFQDQEEPEGEVEGENGNSGDEETTSNAQPASPQQGSRDRASPITEQIPPLDSSDTTADNDTERGETTKLLNEESD